MSTDTQDRTFIVRNSEKCFRFKDEAIINHAPPHKGIYELVTFDENQKPEVLYVGAAFDKNINECLEGHANGSLEPKASDLLEKHPNLYFDFLTQMTHAKTVDDAQDVHWWLVQKYKPKYNDVNNIQNSGRAGAIKAVEED